MRYGVIVEAGNCVYCGRHIDSGGNIFLCEECRRREEEKECLHGKQKEGATATERPERLITVKEPRRKPTDREERLKLTKQGGKDDNKRKPKNKDFRLLM